MKKSFLTTILLLSLTIITSSHAQFYIGPLVGFKSYGLKGTATITQGGNVQQLGQADAGTTAFTAGASVGYQMTPSSGTKVQYNLDLNLDLHYSTAAFFEQGFNNVSGAGSFAASGLSGGSTTNFSFDLVPLHRLTFSNSELFSPFAGIGLGLNLFSTSDLTQTAQGQTATAKGNSELKLGLLIAYGTLFRASDKIAPFIELKHYLPFGSTTQLTNDPQGGTIVINDVPGFFGAMVGVRFTL